MKTLKIALLGIFATCIPAPLLFAQGPLTVGQGGQLLLRGQPFRAVGANYANAALRVIQNGNDTSYRQGFADLASKGIPFARIQFCPFWPVEYNLYLSNKAEYFRRLDDVVASAQANHVGLICDLFWNWSAIPDIMGESVNQWGNLNSRTIAFMRQYTTEVVTRYLASPTIWAWEFGNEFNLFIDLPYPSGLPSTVVGKGEPATRTTADQVTHDIMVTALVAFGTTVRQVDSNRPIL